MALEKPLYVNRFITGLFTNRSELVTPFSYAGLDRIDRYDALIDGLNIEVSPKQTLQRRPGFSKFYAPQLGASDVPLNFYSFRHSAGLKVLADMPDGVLQMVPTGTVLFSKTNGAQGFFVSIGDTLYYANGTDVLRWRDSATSWGITAPVTAPTFGTVAGSLSPTKGFRWVFVFKDATNQHPSTASPESASTLAQTNKNFQLSGERSTNTRVTKIEIYRTKDGGSTFFYEAEVDNPGAGTWSYTSSTADSGLNTSKIAPVAHANDPPPAGLTNICFHSGYVWGSVGSKVYYNAGPDCLNGVPEECWPPGNYFTFPAAPVGLMRSPIGLLVITPSDIHVIRGANKVGFYPQTWMGGIGAASANAFTMDGETFFIYTSSGQLLSIGTGFEDVGFPVAELSTWIASGTAYLAAHRRGTDAGLYLADSSGKIIRFDLNMKAWSPRAEPATGCKAIKSIEVAAGSFELLMGKASGSGYVWKRDSAVFTDDGTAYVAHATIGSIVLAPPDQALPADSVLLHTRAVGTLPTVSVLLNEVSGTFTSLPNPVNDPPQLGAGTSINRKRHDFRTAASALPELVQSMQVKIEFPAENVKNEIMGFGIA